jgi:putative PIN family toxin of toxin-antitoxin system
MPVSAVLDTTVWVSYFINARADYLISWILNNDVTVFTSDALIIELDEVLQRPKFKIPFPVTDFIELHKSVCTKLKPLAMFAEAPDADDNFLFDLCIKANAKYLVTSDRRLINFKPGFDLLIVPFSEFRTRVSF